MLSPNRTRHYSFYDAGAYDGQTEHHIMCSFYSINEDGSKNIGQSQLVLASEWPQYKLVIEGNGWSNKQH